MGARGPAPTPTALRIVEGNPGKRPLNKKEPRPTPIAPACPRWLELAARREWRRVSKELGRLGLLTLVDQVALAGYCQSYARWQQYERIVSEEGPSYETHSAQGGRMVRARPEVKMAQVYLGLIKQFCAEFGLTPSSRGRMAAPRREEEEDDGLGLD